jgi:hypothetical protein
MLVRNAVKLIVLASVALLGLATTAGAQTYPPSGCGLAASTATVTPGGTVTISTSGACAGAAGFAPGTTVTITFASDPVTLGTTTADGSGGISTAVAIPADAAAGEHTITATGPAAAGGSLSISTTVVVPGPGGATLAFTGSSGTGPELWIALGAVVLGLVLVVAGRRRARAHS